MRHLGPMNNNPSPSNLELVEQFDTAITIIVNEFSGSLYYHEMIGILAMHQHRLSIEAQEDVSDEED